MPILPDEARLLFLAIKPHDPRDDEAFAALATSPVRWPFLVRIAERERMVPILWQGLRARGVAAPPDIDAAVRRWSAVAEFKMALKRRMLEQVVARLAAERIPVMLLKGAALALSVYPSFAQRPMNDLDVLVPAEQAPRAWQAFRDLGWTPELKGDVGFYDAFHHLMPLVDPAGSEIVLEIHRSMLPQPDPFRLAESELWRDSAEVRVGEHSARIPSTAHQLLHLSVHFAWQHSLRSGLARTVRDVATVVAAHDLDWDTFARLARDAKAATSVYWTLALTRDLAGAEIPREILDALRPHQPRAVTAALQRAYVTNALFDLCPSIKLAQTLWSAGIQPVRSGHGSSRPWQTTDRFSDAFQVGERMPLLQRIRTSARDLSSWVRFARVVVGR